MFITIFSFAINGRRRFRNGISIIIEKSKLPCTVTKLEGTYTTRRRLITCALRTLHGFEYKRICWLDFCGSGKNFSKFESDR